MVLTVATVWPIFIPITGGNDMSNYEPTREDDELELALMRLMENSGSIVTDDEGEVPYRLTLGQMAFGSDLEAERAFHRIVTAYDGGAL